MGTWNAFYIKGEIGDGVTAAAIRQSFPNAQIDAAPEYVGVALSPDDWVVPEQQLAELSSRLRTNVIWLSFQSVVDAFQFHHWRDGAHLRALVYGCFAAERTWERADGSPVALSRERRRAVFRGAQFRREASIAAGDESYERHEATIAAIAAHHYRV